jgi:predicted PurR-regulated permease PerM
MPYDRDEIDHARERPHIEDILPNLAQQVRLKKLGVVRIILFVLGVIMTAIGVPLLVFATEIAHEQVRHEQGFIVRDKPDAERERELKKLEEQAAKVMTLAGVICLAIGAAYSLFGLLVKTFPVPITIMSLVSYITGNAIILMAAADPLLLIDSVWHMSIGVIVVLGMSVQWAIAYERERRRSVRARRKRSEYHAHEDDGLS